MTRMTSQVSLTQVGKYLLLEKIGRGGMGTVYRSQDPDTGRPLAVKVLPGEVADDPVLRMRFAQECQVARKLNHPNIVRVLDFGLDGTKPFLVMEFVDGETLGQCLERTGKLSEAEAVRIICQVGRALHWAHQCRLIHRDVKPDNILLATAGQAKLTDLGLVKDQGNDFNLTHTMSCLGTPNFMSPEQFEDAKRADALSDLYSLAATLYMAVTGVLPFKAHSVKAVTTIYKKKLANELVPPQQLVPELSERVAAAILQGLRVERQERPASVQEFLRLLTDTPAAPAPLPGVKRVSSGRIPRPSDKRAKKRFRSGRDTACQPFQPILDKPWFGKVINISETGVCLELNRRFERGTLLTITIENETIKRRSLVVRVVWVKQLAEKVWQLGCTLDRPLGETEVHELR